MTYLEAIRTAMLEEMERDEDVFVLGEDVGVKGGVFGATNAAFTNGLANGGRSIHRWRNRPSPE